MITTNKMVCVAGFNWLGNHQWSIKFVRLWGTNGSKWQACQHTNLWNTKLWSIGCARMIIMIEIPKIEDPKIRRWDGPKKWFEEVMMNQPHDFWCTAIVVVGIPKLIWRIERWTHTNSFAFHFVENVAHTCFTNVLPENCFQLLTPHTLSCTQQLFQTLSTTSSALLIYWQYTSNRDHLEKDMTSSGLELWKNKF